MYKRKEKLVLIIIYIFLLLPQWAIKIHDIQFFHLRVFEFCPMIAISVYVIFPPPSSRGVCTFSLKLLNTEVSVLKLLFFSVCFRDARSLVSFSVTFSRCVSLVTSVSHVCVVYCILSASEKLVEFVVDESYVCVKGRTRRRRSDRLDVSDFSVQP